MDTLQSDKKEIQINFFKNLYQFCNEGFIECRFLPSEGQTFFPLKAINKFSGFSRNGQNIFFGVALRDGRGGRKDNIVEIPVLWVDIDFKDTPKEQTDSKLKDFPNEPSVIVDSGGGYHVYWILKEPESREGIFYIENILKRLAHYFDGDQGATDASRILRVPGTLNFKYTPPREVKIIKLSPALNYNPDDFDSFLPELPITQNDSPPINPTGWQEELLAGVPEGQRNETATHQAGRYLGKGLSEQEVLEMLCAWNQKNNPPLPEKEIQSIVESVTKTHKRNHKEAGGSMPENNLKGRPFVLTRLRDLPKRTGGKNDVVVGWYSAKRGFFDSGG